MTKEQADTYADRLLALHETFVEKDTDNDGALHADEVVGALFQHGLMPGSIVHRQHVVRWPNHGNLYVTQRLVFCRLQLKGVVLLSLFRHFFKTVT